MNKYSEMSDFEINKLVAFHYLSCDYQQNEAEQLIELVGVIGDGADYYIYGKYDPCNNPADAMPIIIDNNIDLLNGDNVMPELFGHHSAYVLLGFNRQIAVDSRKEDKTIYRLGMEVYLLMKDAENEQV